MKILYAAAEIAPFARMTYTADLLRLGGASKYEFYFLNMDLLMTGVTGCTK